MSKHGSVYASKHTSVYTSKHSSVYTLVLPWRKICIALPAVALISGGIVLSAQAAQAPHIKGVPVSKVSPAIVVPSTALTVPAVRAPVSPGSPAGAGPVAPALALPPGTAPGSSTPVTLDSTGIPIRALEGYRRAASLVNSADPACHIDWALLAAIGRVESDHGRFGGSQLNSAGVDQPAVIGVRLDGSNGNARIIDPAGFALDGDHVFEHAVGPMQFLPETWRIVGVDADGDGVKNPESITDAATAAAVYLCSGNGDLRQPGDLHTAIMRYNASNSYASTVTAIADAYRHGVSALPASALPASGPAPSTSARSTPPTPRRAARPAKPAPAQPGSTPSLTLIRKPPPLLAPTPVPSTSTATPPIPVATPTCAPLPGTTATTATGATGSTTAAATTTPTGASTATPAGTTAATPAATASTTVHC